MNVEIMQWDLRLSDVVKLKSIISLAQLHGQLPLPSRLPVSYFLAQLTYVRDFDQIFNHLYLENEKTFIRKFFCLTSSHYHQLPDFFSKLISESPCINKKKYIYNFDTSIDNEARKKNYSIKILE
jgi:hypothetical protein